MNWVKKYYTDALSEYNNANVRDLPHFFNGMEVKEPDSPLTLLLYQEVFSNVVVVVIIEDDIVIDRNRMIFSQLFSCWIFLSE